MSLGLCHKQNFWYYKIGIKINYILLDFKVKPTNTPKKEITIFIDDLYIFPLIFTLDNIQLLTFDEVNVWIY